MSTTATRDTVAFSFLLETVSLFVVLEGTVSFSFQRGILWLSPLRGYSKATVPLVALVPVAVVLVEGYHGIPRYYCNEKPQYPSLH